MTETTQITLWDELMDTQAPSLGEPVTITYGTPGLRSIEFTADPRTGRIEIYQENVLADDETPTFTAEEFGLIGALLLTALGE